MKEAGSQCGSLASNNRIKHKVDLTIRDKSFDMFKMAASCHLGSAPTGKLEIGPFDLPFSKNLS